MTRSQQSWNEKLNAVNFWGGITLGALSGAVLTLCVLLLGGWL